MYERNSGRRALIVKGERGIEEAWGLSNEPLYLPGSPEPPYIHHCECDVSASSAPWGCDILEERVPFSHPHEGTL